jgi:hypothetical protein
MAGVIWLHHYNQRVHGDSERIIGIEKGESPAHFGQRPH